MTDPTITPYGAWPSPISAASLVQGAVGISEVVNDPRSGRHLWWAESRPGEGGRTAVMCLRTERAAGEPVLEEITPPDANARTLVHEYGGGAWWPDEGSLYWVDFADQRLRRTDPGADPVLLTPEPVVERGLRYADLRITPDRRWCVCVREDHGDGTGDVRNELVAIATDGSQEVRTLWSGADFVSSPRLAPDSLDREEIHLAWISWDHPNMPWDATRLHVHRFAGGELGDEVLVLDDGESSLCEPGWSLAGLRVCSDHAGWWNLYDVDLASGALGEAVSGPFDIATPPWVFGMQRWASVGHGSDPRESLVAVAGLPTGDELVVDGATVALPDTEISSVTPRRGGMGEVAYAGAGFGHESEVVSVSVIDGKVNRQVVRPARDLPFPRSYLVEPEAITFPTGPPGADGEGVAHGLFYPPTNPDHAGPDGQRPPLLVMAHGGPTGQARRRLQPAILYWTSRGIAVVDVDYRGSTGYGRSYRNLLRQQWGIYDVEDAVAAARYLADRGDVDPDRLMIRGGSAGGFTVLAALAFHDVFAAGSNLFGVADLEALAAETHKFESRYLDTLVGPYPEARDVYVARSPINHVDGFDAPMIVLQGAEDAIVPPSQSERIVDALEAKGVPVAYLLFEGEQHGFRQAANIIRALEAELVFFGEILGFEPDGDLPPVEIRR